MKAQLADDELGLLDLLQTIVDNLRLLVLGPLAVGLAAFGFSCSVPPSYSAITTFLPPQQHQHQHIQDLLIFFRLIMNLLLI